MSKRRNIPGKTKRQGEKGFWIKKEYVECGELKNRKNKDSKG